MTDATPCECNCGRPSRIHSWYCGPCYAVNCEAGRCNVEPPGPEETIPARPDVNEDPPDYSTANSAFHEKHERYEEEEEREQRIRDKSGY